MNEVTLTFAEQSTARMALLGMMSGVQNDLKLDLSEHSVEFHCDLYQEAYALYAKLLLEGLRLHPDELRLRA